MLEAIAGTDPNDEATMDCPQEIDLHSDLGKDRRALRVALALLDYRAFDSEEKQAISTLIAECKKHQIEIVECTIKTCETYYKVISSTEIQLDFDHYLSRYGNGKTPGTFKDLVKMYEMRAQHHPYGFDRLTDALKFSPNLENDLYKNALIKG